MAKAAELRKQARARAAAHTAPVEAAPSVAAFERTTAEPIDRARTVTIVTGLPRSGTSMMMQMLAAGGIEAYTDQARAADEDNPRGYFEHENAIRLHEGAAWVAEARGKAVKIVAQLVPHLPSGEQYRIVFMHRNLDEVIASQRAMLERLRRTGGRIDPRTLARTFTRQLVQVQTWLQRHPDIQVAAFNYADVVSDAGRAAARLARFLGQPFDERAAIGAVDASLRRQGSGIDKAGGESSP
jgi:hypothetical protein